MNKLYSTKRFGQCCVVPQCSMRTGTNNLSKIKSHRFPLDTNRCAMWVKAIRRSNWSPKPHSILCSLHFIEGKPSNDPSHPDWVPSIFPFQTRDKAKDAAKLSRFQRADKRRQLTAGGATSSIPAAPNATIATSILIKKEVISNEPQNSPGKKRKIDPGTSSSREKQRQNAANGAPSTLPTDAAEGESSSSVKNEQSTTSQPNTSTSIPNEPKPKIAKIPKPPIEKIPTPSLIVAGPRQRKPTQPYSPAVTATALSDEYVFEGWRLVNMGYFIKSLQQLNDHEGRECNFSDMKVLAETSDRWNVGIVFSCKLCPTTKVIWMENPNCKEAPSSPIIIKRRASAALVRPPIATASKTRKKVKSKSPAPSSRTPKPNRSKRKAPTPPPDIATTAPISQQQMTIQVDQISNYPQQLIIRPNLTLRYGQPPTPFVGQLQPVVSQQVPNIAQSQVIGQTQIIQQLSGSVIGQSQIPLTGLPPVASIKQEIILPDDGTILPSFINSSEPTRVEMSFCVDQDESGSVPTDTGTPMDVVTKDTALTQTSLPSSCGQLSSSSAMDTNTTHVIAPTIALSVDLNLVKKEVDEETPPCQQNIPS